MASLSRKMARSLSWPGGGHITYLTVHFAHSPRPSKKTRGESIGEITREVPNVYPTHKALLLFALKSAVPGVHTLTLAHRNGIERRKHRSAV